MKKNKIQQNISSNKFVDNKFIFSIVVLIVILFANFGLVNSSLAQEINKNNVYPKLEREIINQLNQERVEHNLGALNFNLDLRRAAGIKLGDLIENKYFLHTSPAGVKAWDILGEVGYDYKFAGENLAMKFHNAIDVHNAWMESKSHRENILFEDYTEVAVAVGRTSNGSLVAVEFFGKPMLAVVKDEANEDAKSSEAEGGEFNSPEDSEGSGNLLTQIVSESQSVQKDNFKNIIPAGLSADQMMSLNNMILLIVGIVCLILVVNIWVLEKEDERIMLEAKELCNTKKVLAG
jgi:uncharacterized protein YkwD